MATILDIQTLGEIQNLRVDDDPSSGAGTPGPIGSLAQYSTVGNDGFVYLKYGVNDTDWDKLLRLQDGSVKFGNTGRLPIYYQDGYQVDDDYGSGNNLVHVNAALPSGTRTAPLEIFFPDLGVSVNTANVVLSEGAQTINGIKTFGDNAIFNQDVTVAGSLEVQGTLTYLSTTNTTIEDALITLNKGGGAASATNTGFELEEDSSITGFFKTTASRLGFQFKAPGQTGTATLLNPAGDFSYTLPEESGTITLGDGVDPTGNYSQLAFFQTKNQVNSEAGTVANALTWDQVNNFLGIQQAAPKSILHVGNNTSSGTINANAVILGVLNASDNVGSSALIANGSGGANTASGTDSAVFGASNVASGSNSFVTGSSNTASGINSQAGGLGSTADGDYSFARGRRAKTGGFAGTLVLSDSQDADVTANLADSVKLRYQNGYSFNKGLDNTDPNFNVKQASVTTSNATVTILDTFTIPTDSVAMFEVRVIAERLSGTAGSAGDSASYVRTARVKSIGGSLTLKDLQSDYTSEDQGGWNCQITVSGGNVLVRVTGAANQAIKWHSTTKIQILS